MLVYVLRILFLEPKSKKHIFLGIAFTLLLKVFEVIPDILIGLMIDLTIRKERSFLFKLGLPSDLSTIYILSGMILIAWIGNNYFQFLSSLEWKHAARIVQYRLRMDLCYKILAQDLVYSSNEKESLRENHRSINYEIEMVELFINRTMEDFFKVVFSSLITGIILYWVKPEFLYYALVSLFLTIMLAIYLQKKIRPLYDSVKKATKQMHFLIDEFINAKSIISDFGIEDRIHEKVESSAEFLNQESKKTSYLNAAMIPLTRIFIQLGLIVILIHGAILVFNGQIFFGAFAVTIFLSRKFLFPLSFLGGLVDSLLKGAKSAKAILSNFDKKMPLLTEKPNIDHNWPEQIRFKEVSYSIGSRKVLNNVNFDFKFESINVIKGRTGAGKTTLFRLLMREIPIDCGAIFFGSTKINQYSLTSWRKKIAIVPQHPKLFTATVINNITLFAKSLNADALQRAISVSLTAQFVDNLPQGVHSIVGPYGIKLSKGQVQSIALARAIYTDAMILLLDEPTSGFDLEREKLFLETIKTILKGRMVIITSHRKQTIEAADALFEL